MLYEVITIMDMKNNLPQNIDSLYSKIAAILDNARNTVYNSANFEMVKAYWEIGRAIVEQEQQGENRAEYGISLIKDLSEKLSGVYGKGFNETNLKYMRQFYQTFKNGHALRGELTWTHYRLLLV